MQKRKIGFGIVSILAVPSVFAAESGSFDFAAKMITDLVEAFVRAYVKEISFMGGNARIGDLIMYFIFMKLLFHITFKSMFSRFPGIGEEAERFAKWASWGLGIASVFTGPLALTKLNTMTGMGEFMTGAIFLAVIFMVMANVKGSFSHMNDGGIGAGIKHGIGDAKRSLGSMKDQAVGLGRNVKDWNDARKQRDLASKMLGLEMQKSRHEISLIGFEDKCRRAEFTTDEQIVEGLKKIKIEISQGEQVKKELEDLAKAIQTQHRTELLPRYQQLYQWYQGFEPRVEAALAGIGKSVDQVLQTEEEEGNVEKVEIADERAELKKENKELAVENKEETDEKDALKHGDRKAAAAAQETEQIIEEESHELVETGQVLRGSKTEIRMLRLQERQHNTVKTELAAIVGLMRTGDLKQAIQRVEGLLTEESWQGKMEKYQWEKFFEPDLRKVRSVLRGQFTRQKKRKDVKV